MPKPTSTGRADVERRILEATAELVARMGLEEVSMRAVAAAAGLQTPALYRVFEDKNALLRRLTTFAFERYLAAKQDALTLIDPVGDLSRGWDLHVGFGLANPQLYPLMFGGLRVGSVDDEPQAVHQAYDVLVGVLRRIAGRGLLTTTVESAAVRIYAATLGATFFLLGLPPGRRDPAVVLPLRDSVFRSVVTDRDAANDRASTLAGSVRAVLAHLPDDADPSDRPGILRPAELALLRDWLQRLTG